VYRDKVLYHKQISIENIIRFSRNPDYKDLPIMYFADRFSYVTGSTPEFLDKLEQEKIDALDPISGIYDVKSSIYKIGVYGFNKAPEKLVPPPFDLRICYDSHNWLEYTSRFANKGLAVSDLQMRLYLSKLDTAAFGDGDNDIEMFSKAKYTFARTGGSESF
jgi:HAD superfamily hydrolase (TIGR01484 family)